MDSSTIVSPLAVPTTRTVTGFFPSMSLFHARFDFTISMILVLLGLSKRTNLPSEVRSPKVVVVVVTGHSLESLVE